MWLSKAGHRAIKEGFLPEDQALIYVRNTCCEEATLKDLFEVFRSGEWHHAGDKNIRKMWFFDRKTLEDEKRKRRLLSRISKRNTFDKQDTGSLSYCPFEGLSV